MSPLKAGEYAARLNHDPFLVGLFTILADQNMDARQLGAVADDAIGRFLETNFKSICSAVAVDLLPAELRKVLGEMARQMLLRRNLQPSWEELDGWFGDGSITMRGMRALVHQSMCADWIASSGWSFATTVSANGSWFTRWATCFSCRSRLKTSSPIPISL